MSDLLPSGPKMAPASQTKSQPSKNGPPLATVQTSVHGSPYQDDPYVAHSPLVAAIFILLLALTFLVNLHQTISLTYKYENFVPKIIAVYTHKEFVLFNMLVIVGFVGLLLASSTILWTFAGFTFGLFFALVSTESSAINLANMVALGSLAAHLGASYRPQLYVTDVLLPVPV
ncbi:hypothetical protein HDE_13935 [Halotydeus destructor]|nr:hypothetical protein HDE_13935 [Halotydeus destructor]